MLRLFAISIALIIATGVVFTQMRYARDLDLGLNEEQVIVLNSAPTVGLGESYQAMKQEWLKHPELEIDRTMSHAQARKEAARCMSCGLCFDCQQCVMYCNANGFARDPEPAPGHYFTLDLDACEGCSKCIEVCPCGYLDAREGER